MQIKIWKKIHLEAKFSNLRMAFVPFKNLLRFLQKKCDQHSKIDKKDLSRVAKFVSHNGMLALLNLSQFSLTIITFGQSAAVMIQWWGLFSWKHFWIIYNPENSLAKLSTLWGMPNLFSKISTSATILKLVKTIPTVLFGSN